jgi:TRAP-type C4-dicarboxylate transport system permease small subunit
MVTNSLLSRPLVLINEKLEQWLLLFLFTVMMVLIASEVFRRFVLNESTVWGVQVATYLYIFMSWIGASYAVRRRLHLKMDMFQSKFPSRVRIGVLIVSNVLFVVLMGVVTYYCLQLVQLQYETGRTMFGVSSVKLWWFYGSVPVATLITTVRVIQNMMEDVRVYREDGSFVGSEPLFAPKK